MSSPNTPGLRLLQGKQEFEALMSQVMEARNQYLTDKTLFDQNWHNIKMPILVKIDPDLSPQDKINIAELIMNNPKCKVDGLIVSNTTNSRPLSLKSSLKHETGGLSGKPLKSLATQTISDMYKLTNGNYRFFGIFLKKLKCIQVIIRVVISSVLSILW